MTLIDRYIFRSVLITALMALLVLLSLEVFFTLLTELQDTGRGTYGSLAVGRYLVLSLPHMLYEIFPLGLLLGGLLGLGGLAQSSEVVAMRAAGVTRVRLVAAAVAAGLALSVISVFIGEFIAPHSKLAARDLRATAMQEGVAVRQGRGFWARDGNAFVNVRAVLPGGRLADIVVFEMTDGMRLQAVAHADRADYDGQGWRLQGVSRSTLFEDRVQVQGVDEVSIASRITPEMIRILAADPRDLALRDLSRFIDYLEGNGLNADDYRLALWTKVLGPLTNMAMLMVAVPFAFSHQRSAGVGQRLVIGIVLGLVFFLAHRMLSNAVLLYGYPPIIGASLPSVVFLSAGLFGLARMRG